MSTEVIQKSNESTLSDAKMGPVENNKAKNADPAAACMPWPIPPPNSNPEIHFTKLFINNEWVESNNGETMDIINPSKETIITSVYSATKEDVGKAVDAATAAFSLDAPWRKMDASERGNLLLKLADAIDANKHYLACLESLNAGKPYTHSFFMDTLGISKILRYYAGWTDKMHGKTFPVDGDYLSYTKVNPVGVCGLILPWNMPLISLAMKLAPALCCGNTVIVKPSENTPLTALYVASLAMEVGFPAGVINVLPGGPSSGAALAEHRGLAKISLTGSIKTGQIVSKAASDNFKRLTLELSGKCANIIFADTNVDSAVEQAHQASFMNQGQMCTSGARTFVHEDIYEEFVTKSVARAQRRMVTDPFQLFCEQGPQINRKMFEHVLNLIQSGVDEGAKLECGGKRHGEKGLFIQPTVFSNVQSNMRIAQEEIFGPVQCIFKFKTVEEVIKLANDTKYGLATGIFSNDVTKALEVASRIETGTTWVNCFNAFSPLTPFGGSKMSGKGKEMGKSSLAEYSTVKTTTIKLPVTIGVSSATKTTYDNIN